MDGVHTISDGENVCVQMETSDIPFADALTAVDDNLHDSRGWDSRETVSFLLDGVECEALSPADLVEREIEFHIYFGVAPCLGTACTIPDETTEVQQGGSLHYTKMRILLPAPLGLSSFYVNHETGHTLGLADPTPSFAVNQDAETCRIDVNGQVRLVASIMHGSYCFTPSLVPWPTVFDLISFDDNVASGD